jgi:transposase-like protein
MAKALRPVYTAPTEEAALTRFVEFAETWGAKYPAVGLDPTGTGRKRWAIRWKAALNAFDIAFDGRLSAARR